MRAFLNIAFLFCALQLSQAQAVKIQYTQENDSLLVWIEEKPYIEADSVTANWHYFFNPFDFRNGEKIRKLQVQDTLKLPVGYYFAVYCQLEYFHESHQITGSETAPSNNIFLPGVHPAFDAVFENPNNGQFTVNITTNAEKVTVIGMGGRHYSRHYLQGQNNIEIPIAPYSPQKGLQYLSFRLEFGHPLLKTWTITRKVVVL